MDAATTKAKALIADNPVVVFSKSYCPYCKKTKQTLDSIGAKYLALELDHENDGSDIQQALGQISGQTTVPNIFIAQEHIGGNSDLQGLKSKDLEQKLLEAGALKAGEL